MTSQRGQGDTPPLRPRLDLASQGKRITARVGGPKKPPPRDANNKMESNRQGSNDSYSAWARKEEESEGTLHALKPINKTHREFPTSLID